MSRWCNSCQKWVMTVRPHDSQLQCMACGRVLEDFNFSSEPTFVKDAAGQSRAAGNLMKTIESKDSESKERRLYIAELNMKATCSRLGMSESVVRAAKRFYHLALLKEFIRGRRADLVEATCLYLSCREANLPYLLIDFSNDLQISVYLLGAIYLQLCQALWIGERHFTNTPADPSFFIHKYTANLTGKKINNDVSRTALNIIASMRMDWMQTGRKPSGLWGAAVYVSALAHNITCSKSDVLKMVHVCEATLTKRLIEFEETKSGSLTIEELNAMAKEDDRVFSKDSHSGIDLSGTKEVLCGHQKDPHYKGYLCKSCFDEFVKFSGGLEGGDDPPAFQRAERERAMLAAMEKEKESSSIEKEVNKSPGVEFKKQQADSEKIVDEGLDSHPEAEMNAHDESDTFSDIDDLEVDGYLHNEEEKHFKKIIWEKLNKEYLEEQAAKEAAAQAAREACAANFKGTPEELQAAQDLAAAAALAVSKARKEKQQKRAAEAKNATPAQNAAEATRQMLTKKRLSSKINYDMLEKLFEETGAPESTKKQKTESHYNDENGNKGGRDELDPEGEGEVEEDGDGMEEYGNDRYYGDTYKEAGYEEEGEDYGCDGF